MVEAGHAVLAAASPRVVQTPQTFAAAAVAASRHADVDVSVTLAGPAGLLLHVTARGGAVKTLHTGVAART